MPKLTTNVTVHNPDTGETRTFTPDDDLPDWATKGITNEDVYAAEEEEDQAPVPGPSQAVTDLIGDVGDNDPLMKLTKDELVKLSEEQGADASDSNTKAELASAIRATGYDGDGS